RLILVLQLERVHVLDDQAPRIPSVAAQVVAGGDEHPRPGVRGRPGVLAQVEVGRENPAHVASEPEDRRLLAGAHPEDLGVVPERPEVAKGARGHRQLPALAVFLALGERQPPNGLLMLGIALTSAVNAVPDTDVSHQGAQVGVAKILQLAELAMAWPFGGHGIQSSQPPPGPRDRPRPSSPPAPRRRPLPPSPVPAWPWLDRPRPPRCRRGGPAPGRSGRSPVAPGRRRRRQRRRRPPPRARRRWRSRSPRRHPAGGSATSPRRTPLRCPRPGARPGWPERTRRAAR